MAGLDAKFNVIVFLGLCCVGYFGIQQAREPVKPPNDSWFQTAVVARSEPVLVKFGAPWCGPCRRLDPELDKLARASSGRVDVVRIDVGQHPALARHYGVSSIPRLLLFDHGRVIADRVGYADQKQLQSWIAAHAQ